MNDTLKVLETRRSCRNFKPDIVPETVRSDMQQNLQKRRLQEKRIIFII